MLTKRLCIVYYHYQRTRLEREETVTTLSRYKCCDIGSRGHPAYGRVESWALLTNCGFMIVYYMACNRSDAI